MNGKAAPVYAGFDLGTSALKAIVVDEAQNTLAECDVPLKTLRPRDLWSEQDPQQWWTAFEAAVAVLRARNPEAWRAVRSIGLSGQMHGAVVLDAADQPLRPAILWNDGRATLECRELMQAVPDIVSIAGVEAMPGFLAPKLLWLRRHEPEVFRRVRRIMLPKDYLRLRLTGEFATDMADAAGTLLLDEADRGWSPRLVDAAGVRLEQLPRLHEGSQPSGRLSAALAGAWGLSSDVPVAAGGGDAACGAVGIGAVEDGDAFISLGTSTQYVVTRRRHQPLAGAGIHAFCHAVPQRWFQMAVLLNGASCLGWLATVLGGDPATLVAQAEAAFKGPSELMFLPYLQGERTPHNDANAKGVLFGLHGKTTASDLVQAVLEGVAFSVVDAQVALQAAGADPQQPSVIGGGARSAFWLKLLASALDKPLALHRGREKGPAFGAARLARLAVTGEPVAAVCVAPAIESVLEPDPKLAAAYAQRLPRFRSLYAALKQEFARAA
ncbi:MAG: xylulokinase [Alphaproteobacteria bacterium]|nr:xylulokinase [Alphaproteobacteria bacterium]